MKNIRPRSQAPALTALLIVSLVTSVRSQSLPVADPADVGLSSVRLTRTGKMLEEHIDRGVLVDMKGLNG